MTRSALFLRSILIAAATITVTVALRGQGGLDAEALRRLEFRSIGPSLTTGRLSDIAVDPKNPSVWYVAVSAGNLWKTENRGNTWTPIFDEYGSYSLGAVTVDPRNSSVVWLGTGENNNQRSVSFGDGVYKSTDAGKTWTRMGLENSEHIQNIIVDPRNSDVVFVTAIGPLWNARRRSRPLQDDRWRPDVEGHPHHQSGHWRHRSRDGSEEPGCPLCRRLPAAPRGGTAHRWRA